MLLTHTSKKAENGRAVLAVIVWTVLLTSAVHQRGDALPGSKRLKSWYRAFGNIKDQASMSALKELKRQSTANRKETPTIEGSILEEKELHQLRQDTSGCICYPSTDSPSCSIVCTSAESQCGRTCTHLIYFASKNFYLPGTVLTSFTVSTGTTGTTPCSSVSSACVTTALARAAVAAAAIAVAVAVGVGVPNALQQVDAANVAESNQVAQSVEQFLNSGALLQNPVPNNDLPIPVRGANWTDDGCDDTSVRFEDGFCYPVLRRGPCRDPRHWVILDPTTLQGQCRPRLCGRARVFVGRDGLCHDVNDPNECRGGRRLYYSAFGDPICDCPIGQFPFPDVRDDCVPLFTQGPCPSGQVVTIRRSGRLACAPAACQRGSDVKSRRQLLPYDDGFCYTMGTRGPCTPAQLFGFDVFRRRGQCAAVNSDRSPYFLSDAESNFLDSTFTQLYDDYNDYQVWLVHQDKIERRKNAAGRRQDVTTSGLFQFPGSVTEPILNPCRPGSRNGNNYKCTNPLISTKRQMRLLQAVRSAFECSSGALRATGQCVSDSRTASCGPSYLYVESTGQCRTRLTI